MDITMKLSQEQFDVLVELIEAIAQEKVDYAFGRDTFTFAVQEKAEKLLVEDES